MKLFNWIVTVGIVSCSCVFSENCKWTEKGGKVSVNCSRRGLTHIPKLNDSVSCLDLSHNKITHISRSEIPNHLKYLDMSWNKIKQIKEGSFGVLSNLSFLDLSYCNVRDVDSGVFGELPNLRYLNLSYNRKMGFASLPNITNDLNRTKILSLNFNGINCATGIGTIIKRFHLENIKTTNLMELSLANNRLEIFERGVLYNLPKTLQMLSVAENKLMAGLYDFEVYFLSGLKVLNMSFQLHPPVFPNSVGNQCVQKEDFNDKPFEGTFYQKSIEQFNFNWSLALPPKLETLYAQSSRLYIIDPQFHLIAPNLRHVYLQNNFILSLKREIRAIHNHIEIIDISNNFCSHIFRAFNAQRVRYLNVSHNDFSTDLEEDVHGKLLRTFTNLEVLDVSFNKISSLPKLLLKKTNQLRCLNVSNNRISIWLVDMSTMSNLQLLDLSDNKLKTLDKSDFPHIERLFERSNLTIDLSRNVLACTCENLIFLRWMLKNRNHFRNIQNYMCSSRMVSFDFITLESSINLLQKQCASFLGLYISCAVILAMFVTLIMSIIFVKNKWKLRYLIYKSKQKLGFVTTFNRCSPDTMHYEIDAFLSYSGQELLFVLKEVIPQLEVNRNFRLLIRDRDYLPGIPKVDSIMNSLQKSNRTICIVSKRYLSSKWRDYELNMAKVEGIEDRGSLDYVILILLPEVYNGELPNKIMDLIRKDGYIEYPMESCAYEDFWDRLIRMIEQ